MTRQPLPQSPAYQEVVRGLLRMHQYTIDGPGGATLTVYAQNRGGDAVVREGERVRLRWRPEHTFVVTSSTRVEEEEEQ